MKRFFRLGPVQSTLAFLLASYLQLVSATMHWRFDQDSKVEEEMAKPEGGMLFFWHCGIGLGAACRRLIHGRSWRIMISLSPDGEFITKAATRLGFPAIRGSTGRKTGVLNKGGAAAFMEALDFIAGGGGVLITPDGPRGPAEVMQAGPVMLAKHAQTRVFLGAVVAKPVITLKSWDKTQIPLPFSRGYAVFDGPFKVPHDSERTEVEAIREDWQARLRGLQARALAMLDDPA